MQSGVTEQGQGAEAVLAQVVASAFGVSISRRIRVITGDTDNTPYGGGTWASRACRHWRRSGMTVRGRRCVKTLLPPLPLRSCRLTPRGSGSFKTASSWMPIWAVSASASMRLRASPISARHTAAWISGRIDGDAPLCSRELGPLPSRPAFRRPYLEVDTDTGFEAPCATGAWKTAAQSSTSQLVDE